MKKLPVTEKNLQSAAQRLLTRGRLVSVEVDYLRRTLGNSATPAEMDEKILAVRSMPWSELMQSN